MVSFLFESVTRLAIYSAGHAKSTKMLACELKTFQKNKVQIRVQGG